MNIVPWKMIKLFGNICNQKKFLKLTSEWREEGKTFVFPIVTEPTYTAPLTEETSDYDKGLAKGYHSEVDVLWALKKLSLEHCLGLRLFHGIPIMEEMFTAIATAFKHTETGIEQFIDFGDFKDFKGMKDIENIDDFKKSRNCKKWIEDLFKASREICDIIVLHPAGISVIEIKSNEKAISKANTQLLTARFIIKVMLKIVGIEPEKVPIHTVVALPNPLSEKTENSKDQFMKKLKNNFLLQGTHFKKEVIEEQLFKSTNVGSYMLTKENLDDLSAAFAILKQGKFVYSARKIPKNLRKQMLEGVAMMDIVENLKGQNQLEGIEGSKKIELSRSIFMWLDPLQAEILQDNNPKQYIIGPASTGKTLLIQLKVLEILKADKKSKVLIILPYKHLVKSYVEFFQDAGFNTENPNLLITTLTGPWRNFNDAHIFIDEYCAIGPKESLYSKNHQVSIKITFYAHLLRQKISKPKRK